MKKFVKVFGMLVAALFVYQAQTQDIIHKKNGKVIEAKIEELGTSEIKYRQFAQPDGPIYVEEKENILKIVFADGRTEFYGTTRMDDSEMFAGQKKNAIKISFLGPVFGYTNIIYEHSIKPGRSWEIKGSIIGLGKQYDDEAVGFIGSYAYKFYKKPDFYTADVRRSHILQGGYIKPEVFFGYSSFYDTDDIAASTTDKEGHAAVGILLNLGKQWVFDGDFVFDIAVGFGFGAGKSHRAIYLESDVIPLAGSFTLNAGWTIK